MELSNEIYALIILCVSFFGVVLSYKLGATYVKVYVVLCYITANILTPKIGNFYGFDTTPGTFLFSAIFLSTDMLAERYGRKTALDAVHLSFFAMIAFIIITQLNLLFQPVGFAQPVSDALDVIFSASPRIFMASLVAYVIWQYVDVHIYDKIHRMSGEKLLWLRNNVSTLIGSLGSTFTFFFLAFYGTEAKWMEMFMASISVYWILALLDTAIIYVSKRITPLDVKKSES